MGHGHSHDDVRIADPVRRRRARTILSAILLPLALLTIVGTWFLWPTGGGAERVQLDDPYSAAAGVDFVSGTVRQVINETCPSSGDLEDAGGQAQKCDVAYVEPNAGGSPVPVEVPPEILAATGVEPGDQVRYLDLTNAVTGSAATYIFVDFVRTAPILLLSALYAFVVVLVARWRGFRALLGLIGAYFVLSKFMIPALVEGKPALLVGLVGSALIMIAVLYFAHGFTARTTTALLGTIFGLAVTTALAAWATGAVHLTGVGDDAKYTLVNQVPELSLSGIILCGLLIAGLGVLNDVTITQSSAVWELAESNPRRSAKDLFTAAMRIGRDHIASTVYTIAFAYAGAVLPMLILVTLYDRALLDTFTSGELVEEVVRTLVGSIGLVLAIPVTTAIAVAVVKAVGTGGTPTARGNIRPVSGPVAPDELAAVLAAPEAEEPEAGPRRRGRRAAPGAEPDA
ncbi:YibE/F family protein [Zhihengliuella halotolerans]|uniref:YibE/F-like protein n=1 Tax=Zhihengliuella halotolerans TaxID=370736 RepID=A0A4Q8AE55_9MICC|nr:YibE/F family protein [Zhihengliuella halotolerans]RZU61965.1 YibE/F-like protein [Zhihengliuella halotolerans]